MKGLEMPIPAQRVVASLVMLASCGFAIPADGTGTSGDGDVAPDASTGTSSTGASSTAASSSTTGGSKGGSGEVDSGDAATSSSSTAAPGETEGELLDCNIWMQDCPEQLKCIPYAFDVAKCVPLDPDPDPLHAACSVTEGHVEGETWGMDSCDVGLVCWDVDRVTHEGTCIGLCQGSESDPLCEDPLAQCSMSQSTVHNFCIPHCDPLLQDCSPGNGCYPFMDGFACLPDASGEAGAAGEACQFANACDPGLQCVEPALVPGCTTASAGCCTPFCDLAAPVCPSDTDCIAFFEEDAAPHHAHIGFCGIAGA